MQINHPDPRHLMHGKTTLVVLILAVYLAFPARTAQSFLPDVIQNGPVFTINDPADPGGVACLIAACSLRAAIDAANAASLPGSYAITFDLTYPAQISLAGNLPEITGEIDIIGPGRTALTISGGGLVRIFTIQTGSNLTLSGMTLNQGWNGVEGGGAIRNSGSLVMTNLNLNGNLAGGGNGGGLLNDVGGSLFRTAKSFQEVESCQHFHSYADAYIR